MSREAFALGATPELAEELAEKRRLRRAAEKFLDGAEYLQGVACSKGVHPMHSIQVVGGVTKCMHCGRKVYP